MSKIHIVEARRATASPMTPVGFEQLRRDHRGELADLLVADSGLILLDMPAESDVAVPVAHHDQPESNPRD